METVTVNECWRAVQMVFEADLVLIGIALVTGMLIGQYVYIPVPWGRGG